MLMPDSRRFALFSAMPPCRLMLLSIFADYAAALCAAILLRHFRHASIRFRRLRFRQPAC